MGELENDAASVAMRIIADTMQEMIKYLLEYRERSLEKQLNKLKISEMKKDIIQKERREIVDKNRGYISLKKLFNSGEKLRVAATNISVKNQKEFQRYAKLYGLSYSFISDKRIISSLNEKKKQLSELGEKARTEGLTKEDVELRNNLREQIEELENRKQEKIIIVREKDLPVLLDITNRMCGDIKLENIESEIDNIINSGNEIANYNTARVMDIEKAVLSVTQREDITKPLYILDSKDPDTYIKTTAKVLQQTENGETHDYVSTTYEVCNHGILQECNEFSHKKFIRNTDFNGNNTSRAGEEHWNNMQIEIKDKSGFSGKAIVFDNEQEFETYRNKLQQNIKQDKDKLNELEEAGQDIIKEEANLYNESISDEELSKVENQINEEKKEEHFIPTQRIMKREEAILSVTQREDITKPLYILDSKDQDTYIKTTAEVLQQIQETQDGETETRNYVSTTYEVCNHGVLQKCNEFSHKKFIHNTDFSGNNTSRAGEEHWDNMQIEIKNKSGLSDEVIVFDNEQEFEDYRDDLSKNMQNQINENSGEKNINLDRALSLVTGQQQTLMYIVDSIDPDKYIKAETTKTVKINLDSNTSIRYATTYYEVVNHDITQKCDLFSDGKFRYTLNLNDDVSKQIFSNEDERWKTEKNEIKDKGGFSDSLYVFSSEAEMLVYREQMRTELKPFYVQNDIQKNNCIEYQIDGQKIQIMDCSSIIGQLKETLKENGYCINEEDNKLCDINTGELIQYDSLQTEKDKLSYVENYNIFMQIDNYAKLNDIQNNMVLHKDNPDLDFEQLKKDYDSTVEAAQELGNNYCKIKGMQVISKQREDSNNDINLENGIRTKREWEEKINEVKLQQENNFEHTQEHSKNAVKSNKKMRE